MLELQACDTNARLPPTSSISGSYQIKIFYIIFPCLYSSGQSLWRAELLKSNRALSLCLSLYVKSHCLDEGGMCSLLCYFHCSVTHVHCHSWLVKCPGGQDQYLMYHPLSTEDVLSSKTTWLLLSVSVFRLSVLSH